MVKTPENELQKTKFRTALAGSAGVSLIGVGNWVRLGVSFVCTVCSASGPVVSVVGDDRSGDPLHERCDESDVYEGKVAQVGMVPDLVGRLNTLADRKSTIYHIKRVSCNNIPSYVFIKLSSYNNHRTNTFNYSYETFVFRRNYIPYM